ncbi:hypothetical protein EDD85DRAFT_791810 [Armillaria nabsnona]|nr:hypothetical protein EDD85DRAFT_791810 [Armillaria nabsnona]
MRQSHNHGSERATRPIEYLVLEEGFIPTINVNRPVSLGVVFSGPSRLTFPSTLAKVGKMWMKAQHERIPLLPRGNSTLSTGLKSLLRYFSLSYLPSGAAASANSHQHPNKRSLIEAEIVLSTGYMRGQAWLYSERVTSLLLVLLSRSSTRLVWIMEKEMVYMRGIVFVSNYGALCGHPNQTWATSSARRNMDPHWVDACTRDGRKARDFGVDASLENSQQKERPLLCAGARRVGWRATIQAAGTLEVLSGDEFLVSCPRRQWLRNNDFSHLSRHKSSVEHSHRSGWSKYGPALGLPIHSGWKAEAVEVDVSLDNSQQKERREVPSSNGVFASNIVVLIITQAMEQQLYFSLPAFAPTGVPTLSQICLGQQKSTLKPLTTTRASVLHEGKHSHVWHQPTSPFQAKLLEGVATLPSPVARAAAADLSDKIDVHVLDLRDIPLERENAFVSIEICQI